MDMKKGLLFLMFGTFLFFCHGMNEINNITRKVVNDLLKDGSKYVIIPPGRKPLIVTIDTTILGLPYISELHMEFTVSFYFRMN